MIPVAEERYRRHHPTQAAVERGPPDSGEPGVRSGSVGGTRGGRASPPTQVAVERGAPDSGEPRAQPRRRPSNEGPVNDENRTEGQESDEKSCLAVCRDL